MDEIENTHVEPTDTADVVENPREDLPVEEIYEPNFKFKVHNEEHEFDERVRGAVTSKEAEEHLRDIYTKAYGLDHVKKSQEEKENKLQQTSSEFTALQTQFGRVQNNLQRLNSLKTEDFGTFQKAWEIPDAAVLQRASEILSTHGDPHAQARADKIFSDRLMMLQNEDRLQIESQTSQSMQRQLHEMKMTQAMGRPEIQHFAAEYDRRLGQPGAFTEEVNRLGAIEFHAGRYLDPQVAVAQAHQRLQKLIGPLAPAAAPASVQPSQRPSADDPVPVKRAALPNMGSGRSGTSVSRKPKSIAELRKLVNSITE